MQAVLGGGGVRGVPGARGLPRPGSDDGEQPRPCPWVGVLPSGSWAVAFLQSSPESHFLGCLCSSDRRPASRSPARFFLSLAPVSTGKGQGTADVDWANGGGGRESLRKPLQLDES